MNESYALNKALAKLDGEELSRLYQRVFNTDDGQLVLQDLKNRAFFYMPIYSGDEKQSFINEGKRLIVLNIETRLLPIELKTADTGASG